MSCKCRIALLGGDNTTAKYLSFMLKQKGLVDKVNVLNQTANITDGKVVQPKPDKNSKNVNSTSSMSSIEECIKDVDIIAIMGNNLKAIDSDGKARCNESTMEACGETVARYAEYIAKFNPRALVAICCEPIEALVPLFCQVSKKFNDFNPKKIIGCPAIIQTNLNLTVAKLFHLSSNEVFLPFVGGVTSDLIVPIYTSVRPTLSIAQKEGQLIQNHFLLEQQRIYDEAKKAPQIPMKAAYSLKTFFENIILNSGSSAISPSLVKNVRIPTTNAFIQDTTNKQELSFLTSQAVVSQNGIEKKYPLPKLNSTEQDQLHEIRKTLRDYADLGIEYAHKYTARVIQAEPKPFKIETKRLIEVLNPSPPKKPKALPVHLLNRRETPLSKVTKHPEAYQYHMRDIEMDRAPKRQLVALKETTKHQYKEEDETEKEPVVQAKKSRLEPPSSPPPPLIPQLASKEHMIDTIKEKPKAPTQKSMDLQQVLKLDELLSKGPVPPPRCSFDGTFTLAPRQDAEGRVVTDKSDSFTRPSITPLNYEELEKTRKEYEQAYANVQRVASLKAAKKEMLDAHMEVAKVDPVPPKPSDEKPFVDKERNNQIRFTSSRMFQNTPSEVFKSNLSSPVMAQQQRVKHRTESFESIRSEEPLFEKSEKTPDSQNAYAVKRHDNFNMQNTAYVRGSDKLMQKEVSKSTAETLRSTVKEMHNSRLEQNQRSNVNENESIDSLLGTSGAMSKGKLIEFKAAKKRMIVQNYMNTTKDNMYTKSSQSNKKNNSSENDFGKDFGSIFTKKIFTDPILSGDNRNLSSKIAETIPPVAAGISEAYDSATADTSYSDSSMMEAAMQSLASISDAKSSLQMTMDEPSSNLQTGESSGKRNPEKTASMDNIFDPLMQTQSAHSENNKNNPFNTVSRKTRENYGRLSNNELRQPIKSVTTTIIKARFSADSRDELETSVRRPAIRVLNTRFAAANNNITYENKANYSTGMEKEKFGAAVNGEKKGKSAFTYIKRNFKDYSKDQALYRPGQPGSWNGKRSGTAPGSYRLSRDEIQSDPMPSEQIVKTELKNDSKDTESHVNELPDTKDSDKLNLSTDEINSKVSERLSKYGIHAEDASKVLGESLSGNDFPLEEKHDTIKLEENRKESESVASNEAVKKTAMSGSGQLKIENLESVIADRPRGSTKLTAQQAAHNSEINEDVPIQLAGHVDSRSEIPAEEETTSRVSKLKLTRHNDMTEKINEKNFEQMEMEDAIRANALETDMNNAVPTAPPLEMPEDARKSRPIQPTITGRVRRAQPLPKVAKPKKQLNVDELRDSKIQQRRNILDQYPLRPEPPEPQEQGSHKRPTSKKEKLRGSSSNEKNPIKERIAELTKKATIDDDNSLLGKIKKTIFKKRLDATGPEVDELWLAVRKQNVRQMQPICFESTTDGTKRFTFPVKNRFEEQQIHPAPTRYTEKKEVKSNRLSAIETVKQTSNPSTVPTEWRPTTLAKSTPKKRKRTARSKNKHMKEVFQREDLKSLKTDKKSSGDHPPKESKVLLNAKPEEMLEPEMDSKSSEKKTDIEKKDELKIETLPATTTTTTNIDINIKEHEAQTSSAQVAIKTLEKSEESLGKVVEQIIKPIIIDSISRSIQQALPSELNRKAIEQPPSETKVESKVDSKSDLSKVEAKPIDEDMMCFDEDMSMASLLMPIVEPLPKDGNANETEEDINSRICRELKMREKQKLPDTHATNPDLFVSKISVDNLNGSTFIAKSKTSTKQIAKDNSQNIMKMPVIAQEQLTVVDQEKMEMKTNSVQLNSSGSSCSPVSEVEFETISDANGHSSSKKDSKLSRPKKIKLNAATVFMSMSPNSMTPKPSTPQESDSTSVASSTKQPPINSFRHQSSSPMSTYTKRHQKPERKNPRLLKKKLRADTNPKVNMKDASKEVKEQVNQKPVHFISKPNNQSNPRSRWGLDGNPSEKFKSRKEILVAETCSNTFSPRLRNDPFKLPFRNDCTKIKEAKAEFQTIGHFSDEEEPELVTNASEFIDNYTKKTTFSPRMGAPPDNNNNNSSNKRKLNHRVDEEDEFENSFRVNKSVEIPVERKLGLFELTGNDLMIEARKNHLINAGRGKWRSYYYVDDCYQEDMEMEAKRKLPWQTFDLHEIFHKKTQSMSDRFCHKKSNYYQNEVDTTHSIPQSSSHHQQAHVVESVPVQQTVSNLSSYRNPKNWANKIERNCGFLKFPKYDKDAIDKYLQVKIKELKTEYPDDIYFDTANFDSHVDDVVEKFFVYAEAQNTKPETVTDIVTMVGRDITDLIRSVIMKTAFKKNLIENKERHGRSTASVPHSFANESVNFNCK